MYSAVANPDLQISCDPPLQWNPALRPPCLNDHLVITALFFRPECKNHQVIFFLKSSLMLFNHRVVTTRILWPNGGHFNGVSLYSLQFFPYNSLGSSVGNQLNNQDILLLVIIVVILTTFVWWSCDILRRYNCHSYASRRCVTIFWCFHFATYKKSSEIEGNNTKQLIVNWKDCR